MAEQPIPLLERSLEDFQSALPELEQQGVDTDFLRREYARVNSLTGGMDTEPAEGRRPVAGSGGFLSKPEGASGWDALRGLRVDPRAGAIGAAQGIEQAVTAPARAAQGLMPDGDINIEAFGTASLAGGTGVARAGRDAGRVDEEMVGIFGVRGRTDEDYWKAVEMKEAGVDDAIIWEDTGLQFNTDNRMWEREFDSTQMRLRSPDDPTIPEKKVGAKLYELADEMVDTYDTSLQQDVGLENFLEFDEFFEAYPEMRNVRVTFKPGEGGSYNAITNTMEAGINTLRNPDTLELDLEKFKSLVTHELQHGVQAVDDLAFGSNVNYFLDSVPALKQQVTQAEDLRELSGSLPLAVEKNIRTLGSDSPYFEEFGQDFIDSFQNPSQELQAARQLEYDSILEAYKRYQATAGEVQSRGAELRRELTALERATTPPSETYRNALNRELDQYKSNQPVRRGYAKDGGNSESVSQSLLDYNLEARKRRGLLDRDMVSAEDNILYRPDRGYRFIGRRGYEDLTESGVVRAAQGTKKGYEQPYFMTGKSSSRYGRGESGEYMVEAPQTSDWVIGEGGYARPPSDITLDSPIRIFKRNEDGSFEVVYDNIGDQALLPGSSTQGFNKGGLVTSGTAMSDYFRASSGAISEMDFVGKHKMSTAEFERRFEQENNVDLSGAESLTDIKGSTPMEKQQKGYAEGGMAIDPVSGNEVPPGSLPSEVRDDVDAKLSEGEYVVPADVVRFFGVNFFEQLRDKAKSGMSEMVADERIGGQQTPPPQGISPEDVRAVTEMAEGGLVDSANIDGIIDRVVEAAKTNPELAGIFQKRGIMMAEGGLVTGDTPEFNPAQWSTVGANLGQGQPQGQTQGGGYTYQQFYGPEGQPLMVLFVNGMPAQTIPEGYTTQPPSPEAVAKTAQGRDRDARTPRTPTGGDLMEGGAFGSMGNPLGELDFTDPESVLGWADERVAGKDTFSKAGARLVGGAVGGIPGLLAAAGVRGYDELRDLAVINAAAKVAENENNTDLAEQLREKAKVAEQEFGLSGIIPADLYDGEQIYQEYLERAGSDGRVMAGQDGDRERTTGSDRVAAASSASPTPEPRPVARGERSTRDGVEYRTTESTDSDGRVTTRSVATGSTAPTASARPVARPTRPQPKTESIEQKINRGGGFNRGGLVKRR